MFRPFHRFSFAFRFLSTLAFFLLATSVHAQGPVKEPFLIGGYSNGIYLSALNTETGALDAPTQVAEISRASFLALDPSKKFVYAVSEGPRATAHIAAFKMDPTTHKLEKLNTQPIAGDNPCHVSTDPDGKFALVANYSSGNLMVFPIAENGSLLPNSCNIQHEGSSLNKERQSTPHAHSITFDPSNQWVCAADLGLDQIKVYQLKKPAGVLEPAPTPFFSIKPGSGPRHFAFHPNGKLAFVINELSSTIVSAQWDSQAGKFTELSTISSLPAGFTGNNSTAEILVHPTGKFVYGSNRGDDSIAAFSLDAATGKLTLVGHTKSGGKTPRNFRIDPTGKFLLAENQQSNSIHVLKIDPNTGALSATGNTIELTQPCCIKFL